MPPAVKVQSNPCENDELSEHAVSIQRHHAVVMRARRKLDKDAAQTTKNKQGTERNKKHPRTDEDHTDVQNAPHKTISDGGEIQRWPTFVQNNCETVRLYLCVVITCIAEYGSTG